MKQRAIQFWSIQGSILFFLLASSSVTAQVIPDKMLPVNSIVRLQDNTRVIDGGTIKDSNLFHSFEQFSIPTGSTVLFNNAQNIQNIFGRVTGSSVSNIDGLLKANGIANLFLINPNGIIFGKNARLDIGGSFFASTASAVKFADEFEFSATNPQATPLLTVSVPVGLQLGSNSGAIRVQGTGQGLTAPSTLRSPIIRGSTLTGLSVQPGKTLGLLGGNVTLEGATLTAEGGRIELSSVDSGMISLIPIVQGWTLGYEEVSSYKDIHLSQQTLVDTSGNNSGSIAIQGKLISLSDGSIILVQNQGSQPSGGISVNASELLNLSGISPDGRFSSILRTESTASGSAGNIDISTKWMVIQQGAGISSRSYSSAKGGSININASDSIELLGFSPSNPFITSNITTSTLTSGKAGDITVSTGRLIAEDGGVIISLTRGIGAGGSVTLNATNSVQLLNSVELVNSDREYVPSYLAASTFSTGDAGNLIINTSKMVVGDMATVNTSTIGSGSAGSVTINAFDLEIRNRVSSSAIIPDSDTQKLFGVPPVPSGSPGDVNINTGNLRITDGGQVSVTNEGTSTDAGRLTINARSITLNEKSSINAFTASGEGGDIFVNSSLLSLRNSTINATAGTNGNGGNITINTDILTASNNSAITANAFLGRGGNIRIDTKGLFVSPDTEITASSEQGINGTVEINVLDRNPSQTKVQPQTKAVAPEVVSVCQGHSGGVASTFVNTGAGGVAANSDNQLDNSSTWQRNSNSVQAIDNNWEPSKTEEPIEIVEAQGWILNADGDVVLTAQADPPSPYAEVSASRCHKLTSTPPVSSITEAVRLK
nr:filamentous hemagglutinin N-terminal domain-containing protein [Nostoc sp. ChiSLP03a]MDZ8216174.1 filamentous hemagglutinin N-terminal domain-containing protein [Nostoc sp. ChiSLP03a]